MTYGEAAGRDAVNIRIPCLRELIDEIFGYQDTREDALVISEPTHSGCSKRQVLSSHIVKAGMTHQRYPT